MKPTEVTLIDLEGKPIAVTQNSLKGVSASLTIGFNDSVEVGIVQLGHKRLKATTDWDKARNLCDFINGQLVYRRNEMWETLAIYQATLGRYWEVPWYKLSDMPLVELKQGENIAQGILYEAELTSNSKCLCYWYQQKPDETGFKSVEDCFVQAKNTGGITGSVITTAMVLKIRPVAEHFSKLYPDVFSKLTPWKGATN